MRKVFVIGIDGMDADFVADHIDEMPNFRKLRDRGFGGGRFMRWFFNTAMLSVVRAFLVLIFSSMSAYAFARLRFPGRNLIFGFMLASMMLPAGTRVIGPGDAVTMDFRHDRLNLEIGESGRIERIACY